MKQKQKYHNLSVPFKSLSDKDKVKELAKAEGRSVADYCRRKLLGL